MKANSKVIPIVFLDAAQDRSNWTVAVRKLERARSPRWTPSREMNPTRPKQYLLRFWRRLTFIPSQRLG